MRNVWCGKYGDCLNKAALIDGPGFNCEGCALSSDTGGGIPDPVDMQQEALKCARLLGAIFYSDDPIYNTDPEKLLPWGKLI